MDRIFVAYFHYLSFMILFGTLLAVHLMYRKELSLAEAKRISVLDMIYGASAVLTLVTGLLRFAYFEKGVHFYLKNPYFHTKLTLFIVAALISIVPTLHYLSWRKGFKNNEAPLIEAGKAKMNLMMIRVQLLFLMIIPFLGAMIARGG